MGDCDWRRVASLAGVSAFPALGKCALSLATVLSGGITFYIMGELALYYMAFIYRDTNLP